MLRRSSSDRGGGLFDRCAALGGGDDAVFRVGIIGLDTSHVEAFTQLMNDPAKNYGCKVVAGYPGGSPDIESSISRVKGYTETLQKKFGVEIVDSIETLCQKVDGVLLESVDGRPHLAQVKPVIAAKKPVFIDKPMAGSLADGLEIFRLAKENNVPCWSSSSLRFGPGTVGTAEQQAPSARSWAATRSVRAASEQHHPDLYWYGIHGVEMLFTIMGTGLPDRAAGPDEGLRAGRRRLEGWADRHVPRPARRQGGLRHARLRRPRGSSSGGGYEGYGQLVEEIVKFFKTGKAPVSPEETIEIFAFMTAADESKAKNGAKVELATVLEEAKKQNAARR